VAAQWVSGAGVPSNNASDPTNEGLLLTNNVPASSRARAGVLFGNVEGITLTALGFDIRQASLSRAQGPYFIVQTQNGVNHIIGGCSTRNIQPAPAAGWTRFRFNPAHASPAISPGETVKSISLMMDQGPDQNSGHAVLDNLNINDKFIGPRIAGKPHHHHGGLFFGAGRRIFLVAAADEVRERPLAVTGAGVWANSAQRTRMRISVLSRSNWLARPTESGFSMN
jgi:hypothetical protein